MAEYAKKKLNVEGKTWHLEFMFDSPLFKEFIFDGKKVNKAIFAFKDLDDNSLEITNIFSVETKVCAKLLDYRKGDTIDLTYKSGMNKMGMPIHFYDIAPLGTTKNVSGPNYPRKETTVEIGGAGDVDLSSIDF